MKSNGLLKTKSYFYFHKLLAIRKNLFVLLKGKIR
jgi:hypothetical protein